MTVKTGLDHLIENNFSRLKGKKIGLICNQASVSSQVKHIADLLTEAGDLTIKRFFAPEHGFRGVLQDMESVDSSVDKKTSIEIVSLYGQTESSLAPQAKDLKDLDTLIFDLQDVGTRYYTFAQTLAYTMKVASGLDLEILVIDRPNPISGAQIEGSALNKEFRSFCGLLNTPTRHALSMGELCQMFKLGFGNGEFLVEPTNCNVEVLEMSGWSREMYFDQTKLPWVLPSPNMPSLATAIVYPGGCLFEATGLSEARGTTLPFELIGAPYIDSDKWIETTLETLGHSKGFSLRSTSFLPKYQKHANKICEGVQIHVNDRQSFQSYRLALAMIYSAKKNHPNEFSWRKGTYEFKDDISAIDLLYGSSSFKKVVEGTGDFSEILSELEANEKSYLSERKKYLLY